MRRASTTTSNTGELVMNIARATCALALVTLWIASDVAVASIVLNDPANNDVFQTKPCAVAPCTAMVPLRVNYTGPQVQRIQVVFTRQEDGQRHERALCFFDQIEGISCPAPPNNFDTQIPLQKGTWTAIPQSVVNGVDDFGDSITFTVEDVMLPPAGPVSLSRVEPTRAAARILLRDDDGTGALYSDSEQVRIVGKNLDATTNPFLEVYLSPIPFQESSLISSSALPTGDWCLYKADIVTTGALSGGDSFIDVSLPELPSTTPDRCTVPQRPEGSIFTTKWRWVIRDKWIRQERVHSTWAINSPRDVPWKDAPNFVVTKPQYPLIDGFGFKNMGTDASYKEFLTVFGNNAYVCVDCLPIVGCACVLPRIPDPIYHLLWYPIYKKAVNSTNGSCNGMAATSLLMARNDLETEQFDPLVHYPAGFRNAGDPAKYKDSNFCTPYCSPPKPNNLWAYIRKNHGVQISREFLFEILETLGEAIFDPDSGQVFNGVPNETRSRIQDDPVGYVSCFFKWGNGHCVTPYGVAGQTIHIYDDNNALDATRIITVAGGDYSYPQRTKPPNKGNAFVAFPIDIWKKGRHLLGLSDVQKIFNGETVNFLLAIVVGDAEMEIETQQGSLGFDKDGRRNDFIPGGFLVPLMGPSDMEQRQPPALLAMNQGAPLIHVRTKGPQYTYHTGAGGQLIQLQSNGVKTGNVDEIQLQFEDQSLAGLDFRPESDANDLVPQVGLVIDEGDRALFRYSGIRVPGNRDVSFGGSIERRSVKYVNNSGLESHPIITLDRTSGDYVRTSFGPLSVPDGAIHELILTDWPNVDHATSNLDLDADGNVDSSETIDGDLLPTPEDMGLTSDMAVTIEAVDSGSENETAFSIGVENHGPDRAENVVVRVSTDDSTGANLVQSTGGKCSTIGSQQQCKYASFSADAVQTLRFEMSTTKPTVSVRATVYSSSRDPDTSNDSRTISIGESAASQNRTLWWAIIAIGLFLIVVVLYFLKRN